MENLNPEELKRYHRHLILPEVGHDGQKKLKNARVLLIGAGGLGSPAALYLAAAGVGTIGIVDSDAVDESNLQRQILHSNVDVGRPKTDSAFDRLSGINPHIQILKHPLRLSSQNALEIFRDYDIILDGSDNFPTRYLVNDACVLLNKPNVSGAIFRFEGQASVFWAEKGACYRCLFPDPPPPELSPSCAEAGVLGVLPGIIGAIQAAEAIKLILGKGEPLIDRLLLFDALGMRFREIHFSKDPLCPVCGPKATIKKLIDYENFCNQKTMEKPMIEEITALQLKKDLDTGKPIQIIDVREPDEYRMASIPKAKLIPLNEIAKRQNEIDPKTTAVIHCKMGGRSRRAIEILMSQGYQGRLLNLKGGIMAWAEDVDQSLQV